MEGALFMFDNVFTSAGNKFEENCYNKPSNKNEKEYKNSRYLAQLEKGFAQIETGKGVTHELIEIED